MNGIAPPSSASFPANHRRHEAPTFEKTGVTWPGGRPLAFAILLCAENYELRPRPRAYAPVNVPGMFGRAPYPDFGSFSRREYGNRVGFFRVAAILGKHGFPATAAVDSTVAARCPAVLDEALSRGWAIAAHGRSVNDIISSHMTEQEEREYIGECLDTLQQTTGQSISGWHGPEYGESDRTPGLLAQAGVQYLMDWPNDEQPLLMTTRAGKIVSLPVCADFDDVHAMWHRRISPQRWASAIVEAVQTLTDDAAVSGRAYVLNLHAWLIGQPFRASALESLLSTLRRRDDVWFATTDQIARWIMQGQHPDRAGGTTS